VIFAVKRYLNKQKKTIIITYDSTMRGAAGIYNIAIKYKTFIIGKNRLYNESGSVSVTPSLLITVL